MAYRDQLSIISLPRRGDQPQDFRGRFLANVPGLLKGELTLAKMNDTAIVDATSLQIAGVLDDLFYFRRRTGRAAIRRSDPIPSCGPRRRRSVRVFIYDDPTDTAKVVYPMAEGEFGVWETRVGDRSWLNSKYYLYEVEVFSRTAGRFITSAVTDPYSIGLAPDSLKSFVVDLDSPLTKPDSWGAVAKPELANPADIVLYELHIRDFSMSDETVPEKDRGKYTAFSHIFSNGMLHLWSLAKAGLTHVHLLPAFDFTSVPEIAENQKVARIDQPLSGPDSAEPAERDWLDERPGRLQLGL